MATAAQSLQKATLWHFATHSFASTCVFSPHRPEQVFNFTHKVLPETVLRLWR